MVQIRNYQVEHKSGKEIEEKTSWLWWFGLGIWGLVNLLQAYFTELDPDEAYYWMYSQQLDWGYFDHPPVVATLIRMGTTLFPGELGVRALTVLLMLFTFIMIREILGRPKGVKEVSILLLLLVSMPMFQVYGFIATPDGPLLFTTTLFFLLYDRFTKQETLLNSLLLGFAMAAMLYSKYHGILVIGFTVLSNFSLWKKPKFYVAGTFGVLLFLPHLWWQYQAGFPSFQYHLIGRDDPYELKHTLNYLVNQLYIFNPLLILLVVKMLVRFPLRSALDRAFSYTIYGFLGFFFLSTFKGHTEPQWNAVLSICFVIWLYRSSFVDQLLALRIKRIGLISIGLFLLARLILIYNPFPFKSSFHHTEWVYELEELSDGSPVVFQNSYREASKFNFYSDQEAYTFTDIAYRRNQYDIWDQEKKFHNQRVLMVGQLDWECANCKEAELSGLDKKIQFADSLQITQKVDLQYSMPAYNWHPGELQDISVELNNPYSHLIDFGAGSLPPSLIGLLIDEHGDRVEINIRRPNSSLILPEASVQSLDFELEVPDTLQGNFQFGFGLKTGDLLPRLCSPVSTVQIR